MDCKNEKNILRNSFTGATVLILLIVFASCSPMDSYKKYMKHGIQNYAGKIDSLTILPGKDRVLVKGLFIGDSKITEVRIYWNSKKDSVVVPVQRRHNVDTLHTYINNLNQGLYNFVVITYDSLGAFSVPVHATSKVYGKNYEESLLKRKIISANLQDSGSVLIKWAEINENTGAIGTLVKYLNNEQDTVSVFSSVSESQTTLKNYAPGNGITYKTLYRPGSDAIDTFYVNSSHSVHAEVTDKYLSNTGPGVKRAAPGGRFGVLGAPWITNAAGKNKDGGTIGGYTSDNRWGHDGQINWETWGNTPVQNGKIYQVTSKPLPPGTYTIKYDEYSEIQSNSSVYCIVNAGKNGIPSLSDLDEALGYSLLYNGANVGETTPNKTETQKYSFTLDHKQYVSIGFLGNIVGDGNPGSYFVVGYIKLFATWN
jgi:hypothetical protein